MIAKVKTDKRRECGGGCSILFSHRLAQLRPRREKRPHFQPSGRGSLPELIPPGRREIGSHLVQIINTDKEPVPSGLEILEMKMLAFIQN